MATVFAGMAAGLDDFIQSASGDLSWLSDAMAPVRPEVACRRTWSPTTPRSPTAGTSARTPATSRS